MMGTWIPVRPNGRVGKRPASARASDVPTTKPAATPLTNSRRFMLLTWQPASTAGAVQGETSDRRRRCVMLVSVGPRRQPRKLGFMKGKIGTAPDGWESDLKAARQMEEGSLFPEIEPKVTVKKSAQSKP